MVAKNYDLCETRLLTHEGGYTNDKQDPGGPTNYGITIYDYRKYVLPSANAADVKAMRLSDARIIWKTKYWDALRCDDLPAGLDDTVFDYGANSGIGRSGKVLRRLLGLTDVTYVVTDSVLDAIAKRKASDIIEAMNDERLKFLKGLSTWPTFGGGWGTRVSEVKAFSLKLAAQQDTSTVTITAPQTAIMAKGQIPAPTVTKAIVALTPAVAAPVAVPTFNNWVFEHPSETATIGLLGCAAVGLILAGVHYSHLAKQEAPTIGLLPVPLA